METRDTEQKEITEKFINQAIEGHRAHDLNWKRIPGFNVSVLEKDAVIIGTGRRKDGSFMASMYDEGQAIRLPFPHHSSRKDARFLSESNCFQTVLPFHSNVKEVWNG